MDYSISSLSTGRLTKEDLFRLSRIGFKKIELVPLIQFDSYSSYQQMHVFSLDLQAADMSISGIHGFTFNKDHNLVNDFYDFSEMWQLHLDGILTVCSNFQVTKLIFGAPSFRLEGIKSKDFSKSFLKTRDYLQMKGVKLLLEAVPLTYSCAIHNTLESVLSLLAPYEGSFHFDTGCYLNEGEVRNDFLNFDIDHLHISSKSLGPIERDRDLQDFLGKHKTWMSGVLDRTVVLEVIDEYYDFDCIERDFIILKSLFN